HAARSPRPTAARHAAWSTAVAPPPGTHAASRLRGSPPPGSTRSSSPSPVATAPAVRYVTGTASGKRPSSSLRSSCSGTAMLFPPAVPPLAASPSTLQPKISRKGGVRQPLASLPELRGLTPGNSGCGRGSPSRPCPSTPGTAGVGGGVLAAVENFPLLADENVPLGTGIVAGSPCGAA